MTPVPCKEFLLYFWARHSSDGGSVGSCMLGIIHQGDVESDIWWDLQALLKDFPEETHENSPDHHR